MGSYWLVPGCNCTMGDFWCKIDWGVCDCVGRILLWKREKKRDAMQRHAKLHLRKMLPFFVSGRLDVVSVPRLNPACMYETVSAIDCKCTMTHNNYKYTLFMDMHHVLERHETCNHLLCSLRCVLINNGNKGGWKRAMQLFWESFGFCRCLHKYHCRRWTFKVQFSSHGVLQVRIAMLHNSPLSAELRPWMRFNQKCNIHL